MEGAEEALGQKQQRQHEEGSQKKSSLKIPSYPEILLDGGSTSSSNTTVNPQPDNNDNSSFSQAFAFIRNSEFYNTPPPPPSTDEHAPRHVVAQSEASPSSSSNLSSSTSAIQNRNAILVSHRQKGNPLLKHIRNVRWAFADIVPDYLMGQSSCAVYLSLRYHLLHPDYLYYRIRELQKNYKLRVVLCHIDVEDVAMPLLEVTRTALFHECTLLCGWSLEECGRYLETLKVYENKSADSIREQTDTDYLSRLTHALTMVRRVNKTDAVTLGSTFGSLSRIMDASMEDLARCPGIGERKVKRLHDTFREPFIRVSSHPPASETETPPVAMNAEESFVIDTPMEAGKAGNPPRHGKEPAVSVKSALSAAFAKYGEKIHKQKEKKLTEEDGERSNVALSDEDT